MEKCLRWEGGFLRLFSTRFEERPEIAIGWATGQLFGGNDFARAPKKLNRGTKPFAKFIKDVQSACEEAMKGGDVLEFDAICSMANATATDSMRIMGAIIIYFFGPRGAVSYYILREISRDFEVLTLPILAGCSWAATASSLECTRRYWNSI